MAFETTMRAQKNNQTYRFSIDKNIIPLLDCKEGDVFRITIHGKLKKEDLFKKIEYVQKEEKDYTLKSG